MTPLDLSVPLFDFSEKAPWYTPSHDPTEIADAIKRRWNTSYVGRFDNAEVMSAFYYDLQIYNQILEAMYVKVRINILPLDQGREPIISVFARQVTVIMPKIGIPRGHTPD